MSADLNAPEPLGVADITDHYAPATRQHEHWFWCRRHEQAHRGGEPCFAPAVSDAWPTAEADSMQENDDCIDIGPFMSEREAERLRGAYNAAHFDNPPLGMEIEP